MMIHKKHYYYQNDSCFSCLRFSVNGDDVLESFSWLVTLSPKHASQQDRHQHHHRQQRSSRSRSDFIGNK